MRFLTAVSLMRIFSSITFGVSLSPLKVLFRLPSVFAYAVLMLEVVKESEELCYFLRLRIVFQVEELPLYMLQAWQAFYPAHLTDSDMPVSRVTIALERSVEAFDMLLEDFGRAGTVIIEEVYKPGCHAYEHPDVALFDLPARGSGHLQPHFLIGLVTTDIIVFDNCRPESLVQILQMNPYLADQFFVPCLCQGRSRGLGSIRLHFQVACSGDSVARRVRQ